MEQIMKLAIAAVSLVIGWLGAHETVATECDTLGGFYVGKRVFECSRVAGVGK